MRRCTWRPTLFFALLVNSSESIYLSFLLRRGITRHFSHWTSRGAISSHSSAPRTVISHLIKPGRGCHRFTRGFLLTKNRCGQMPKTIEKESSDEDCVSSTEKSIVTLLACRHA